MAADATGIREYKGAAVQSALTAGINASSTSFPISPTTNWPTGAVGQFTITIDQGTSAEECILCLTQASGVITVVTRGYDGTAPVAHSTGAIVTHGPSAVDVAEANYIANTHAQTSKVTPVDADEMGLFDSAATFGLKKLTIANLKALVATYLASLTQTLTNKDLTSPTNTFPAQIVAGKNAIINGGMEIAQRGVSFAGTSFVYPVDRFVCNSSAYTAGVTLSQVAGGTANDGQVFKNALRLQRDNGISAATTAQFSQALETINSIPLAGKVVVASFYIRKGALYSGASPSVWVGSGTGTDQAASSAGAWTGNIETIFNPVPTTSLTRVFISVTIPANATQIYVRGAIPSLGTAGATDYIDITGFQLELGSTPTTFSRAGGSIGGETQLCRRYLPATYVNEIMGYSYQANNAVYGIVFDTPARVAPTGITTSGTFTVYSLNVGTSATPVLNQTSVNNGSVLVNAGITITAGQGSRLGGGGLILWTGCEL